MSISYMPSCTIGFIFLGWIYMLYSSQNLIFLSVTMKDQYIFIFNLLHSKLYIEEIFEKLFLSGAVIKEISLALFGLSMFTLFFKPRLLFLLLLLFKHVCFSLIQFFFLIIKGMVHQKYFLHVKNKPLNGTQKMKV